MFRMMRLPEVIETTGLAGTTIWRREKAGDFPRRRKITPGAVAWRSDEIEAWMDSRPEVELGAEDKAA